MPTLDSSALRVEAEIRDGLVVVKGFDALPVFLKSELSRSVDVVNFYLANGTVNISDVDMGELNWCPEDESEGIGKKAKACNANDYATKWWGLKVWASKDVLYGVAAGDVVATGVASVFGGGPLAILIGASIMLHIGVLIAYAGDCGVEFDLTWAGVAKKIRTRN